MSGNSIEQLNSNGNRRGMSLESRKNLALGRKTNHRAQKDISITRIQEGMLDQLCPYAKDPNWTWAYAIAEAGLRDCLDNEKAREDLKDRMEGKVTQPIGGDKDNPLQVEIDAKGKLASILNRIAIREGQTASDSGTE